MTVTVVYEGDKHEQGNAICPQCGKRVVIENHWGDPPKCHECDIPYRPITHLPKYH